MSINLIPDAERGSFLEKHFLNPVFDMTVFHIADNMFKDYNGGFWLYATADYPATEERGAVSAPFLYPDAKQDITLTNIFSGEEKVVTPFLGGMIITLYTLNFLMERNGDANGFLHKLYYSLRDAIIAHCSETKRMDAWFALVD